MEKICVVGLGYIGLPTASLLATKGFEVLGVDINAAAVEKINQGEIPIYEPDLDILVRSAVNSGQLKASTQAHTADIFIIAVPTPFQENFDPDLSFIESAAQAMAPFVRPGNLIILESTSPVGTTEKIAEWISELRPELKDAVYYAHCPERVLPGKILQELVDNDRIVGGLNPQSTERACAFYKKFVNGNVLASDARTAELAKLCENAFRDVNIAFANELSMICDRLKIDVWELIRLANRHPRVKILQPGPGVGGHCIAVDPWFIVSSAPEEARLIRTARLVNDSKPAFVVKKILDAVKPNETLACLGLAFKADIDDLRQSPAVEIVRTLRARFKGRILVVEPHVQELPKELKNLEIELVPLKVALEEAATLALLVNHKDFLTLDAEVLAKHTCVDTRGVWA